ncbi:MAG: hypothetical protein K9L28_11240 [Synergistales bacterium]|nr:hypothetical protein [Synergistales bacterium]
MDGRLNDADRRAILEDWGLAGLEGEALRTGIFERVRDIPFGRAGSRDPLEVYRRNKGTCSGKNFLLRELFHAAGLATRDMICLQRWKDLTWFPDDTYGTVALPGELRLLLEEVEVVDFHNYLLVDVGVRWARVDATIDLPLRELGFHTTEAWDGLSDMPLCFVGTDKVWDCGDDGAAKKAELTAQLPEAIRTGRERFLKAMTAWLDQWRAQR